MVLNAEQVGNSGIPSNSNRFDWCLDYKKSAMFEGYQYDKTPRMPFSWERVVKISHSLMGILPLMRFLRTPKLITPARSDDPID